MPASSRAIGGAPGRSAPPSAEAGSGGRAGVGDPGGTGSSVAVTPPSSAILKLVPRTRPNGTTAAGPTSSQEPGGSSPTMVRQIRAATARAEISIRLDTAAPRPAQATTLN